MPRTKRFTEPETAASDTGLEPLELHALAKAARKLDQVRDRLKVGEAQPVDFTVRIRGVVSVAADTASTTREVAPADKLLAAVIEFIQPRARVVLLREVKKRFESFAGGGELPPASDAAIDLADDLLLAASREQQRPKRGNVTAAVEVTLEGRRQKAEGRKYQWTC